MQEMTQGKKQRFAMTMQLEFINQCSPQVVLSHQRKNCCTNFWSVIDASYNSNRREHQFLEDGLVVPGRYSAFSTSKKTYRHTTQGTTTASAPAYEIYSYGAKN